MFTLLVIAGGVGILYIPIHVYNNLRRSGIKCDEAKSNIDVYLKQRYDELHSLQDVVKGYQAYETRLFQEVVYLRNLGMKERMDSLRKRSIDKELEERIPSLLATIEDYPDLKANEQFLHLQQAISNNEDNIAAARRAYNGYVNLYNTAIMVFPQNVLAAFCGFRLRPLYEMPKTERREADV